MRENIRFMQKYFPWSIEILKKKPESLLNTQPTIF
jgi:hypothetical protein